jgi:hypothetical protein
MAKERVGDSQIASARLRLKGSPNTAEIKAAIDLLIAALEWRAVEHYQISRAIEMEFAVPSRWNLSVVYDLDTDFRDMDSKIENILGVEAVGSGAGFGERDISFCFPNKNAAADAKRKLKAKLRNKVRCEITPNG